MKASPSDVSKPKEIITNKVRKDIGNLKSYWPKKTFTLTQIVKEKRYRIELINGDSHEIDEFQLRKILNLIPEYLWDLVKIPFTLRYEKDEDGRSWYVIVGDRWQRRAIELLLYKRLSSEGVKKLNIEEFKELIKKYNSLVFVSISTLA